MTFNIAVDCVVWSVPCQLPTEFTVRYCDVFPTDAQIRAWLDDRYGVKVQSFEWHEID